jgi:hypothetical protein
MGELESLCCPVCHVAANIVGVDVWLGVIGADGAGLEFDQCTVAGRMNDCAFLRETGQRALVIEYTRTCQTMARL